MGNVKMLHLSDGSSIEASSPEGREVLRHSTSHVMAQAVCRLHPGTKYAIGPAIEDGFYYDFDIGRPFHEDDLAAVDAEMRKILKERQRFERVEYTPAEGLDVFKDQPFKREIIEGVDAAEGANATVSVYKNGDWQDLCRGPHVAHTGMLPAFKLMRVAGAYWRGDERNPMLQRIYGTAWETKDALAAHLHMLEEAERRYRDREAILGPTKRKKRR